MIDIARLKVSVRSIAIRSKGAHVAKYEEARIVAAWRSTGDR